MAGKNWHVLRVVHPNRPRKHTHTRNPEQSGSRAVVWEKGRLIRGRPEQEGLGQSAVRVAEGHLPQRNNVITCLVDALHTQMRCNQSQ